MKVSVVFGDPAVQLAGNADALELELVAHLLGMATHDNNNVAPEIGSDGFEPIAKPKSNGRRLAFLGVHRAVKLAEDQEAAVQGAYVRAVNNALRPMRLPNEPKSPVSRLFEELHCPTG